MTRIPTFLAVAVFPVLCGCSFSRSVVNPHHRDLDTSWIVPGRTTRAEVIERLGMPPGVINGRGGIKGDSMRWVTRDAFAGRFEAGYIVTPTFEVSREHHQHDLLVKFAADGTVELVSRTESLDERNRVVEFREAP